MISEESQEQLCSLHSDLIILDSGILELNQNSLHNLFFSKIVINKKICVNKMCSSMN